MKWALRKFLGVFQSKYQAKGWWSMHIWIIKEKEKKKDDENISLLQQNSAL
jgi:hypothetical protein